VSDLVSDPSMRASLRLSSDVQNIGRCPYFVNNFYRQNMDQIEFSA